MAVCVGTKLLPYTVSDILHLFCQGNLIFSKEKNQGIQKLISVAMNVNRLTLT